MTAKKSPGGKLPSPRQDRWPAGYSYRQPTVKQMERARSRPPEQLLPFAPREYAMRVQDRPPECVCTWVPDFSPVHIPVHADGTLIPYNVAWEVAGFRMKFANAMCPSRGHASLSG